MLSRKIYRSPWEEMERMQREINQVFNHSLPGRFEAFTSFPLMNVWTNEDEAMVTAEVPGIQIEDFEISVTGDTLTLSGERKEDLHEESRFHRRERSYGGFYPDHRVAIPRERRKSPGNPR